MPAWARSRRGRCWAASQTVGCRVRWRAESCGPLLGPVAQKPLGGRGGSAQIAGSARGLRLRLQGATVRPDPGQRLELPGLDRRAAGESREQESSY